MGYMTDGLTFNTLRSANIVRLPHFKNAKGEPAHKCVPHELPGFDWTPAQWLQAVVGELGEYANIRKKLERGDIHEAEFLKLATDEIADVQIYLDILAYRLGIDLGFETVLAYHKERAAEAEKSRDRLRTRVRELEKESDGNRDRDTATRQRGASCPTRATQQQNPATAADGESPDGGATGGPIRHTHEGVAGPREIGSIEGAFDGARATGAVMDIDACVARFLTWPLPDSVCADPCAARQGPGRTGTNLLTAIEAKAMLEHILPPKQKPQPTSFQLVLLPKRRRTVDAWDHGYNAAIDQCAIMLRTQGVDVEFKE